MVATGSSSLTSGSVSCEKLCSRAIVALVSFRKVGKTWKVAAMALLLAAVVANVASPAVISVRSADEL